MAHYPGPFSEYLCLHTFGRQQKGSCPHLCESVSDLFGQRSLARCQLDIYPLGPIVRSGTGDRKVGAGAAKAAGDKNMEMVAVKDLLNLTGYIRGGCSPVGMKKKYSTYFDETAQLWEDIAVSAGERGHQVIVPPESLVKLTDAEFVDIIL